MVIRLNVNLASNSCCSCLQVVVLCHIQSIKYKAGIQEKLSDAALTSITFFGKKAKEIQLNSDILYLWKRSLKVLELI